MKNFAKNRISIRFLSVLIIYDIWSIIIPQSYSYLALRIYKYLHIYKFLIRDKNNFVERYRPNIINDQKWQKACRDTILVYMYV